MNLAVQDLRYALRMMRRNRSFTLIIILSLAIGIGTNSIVFSVVNALLLHPLQYPEPDRLAILWLRVPGIGITQDWPSPGEYNDIKTQTHVFKELALARGQSFTLTGLFEPLRVQGMRISSGFLPLLGAEPLMGRIFFRDEDAPGQPNAAVLTYGLWTGLFGADPHIVGRSVILNGAQYTVVGVLRSDFVLNHEVVPTLNGIAKAEIFLPLPLAADASSDYVNEIYNVLGRLKPGVTFQAAQTDLNIVADHIRDQHHRDGTFTISAVPLTEQVVGSVRRALLVLLCSVTFVLLIACSNVANLLLFRTASRKKEVAIRAALGASRRRLVRQLLTESLALGLLGGAAGLVLAALGLYMLKKFNPGNIPRLDEIAIDSTVLVSTIAISILTGIIFGTAPALRLMRVDFHSNLKESGRSSQSEGGFGLTRNKLRSLLVVSEIALSLVLLAGSGLLIRSFTRLLNVPPGYNPDRVISLRLALTDPKYNDAQAKISFYENVAARVRNLPGVTTVGMISALPLAAPGGWGGLAIDGYMPPPNEPELQVDQRIATPDYFRTMQIPLLKGRFFAEGDTLEGQPVSIVDEKMARRFWPHQDPIGKRIRNNDDPKSPWTVIVGIVGSVNQHGLDLEHRAVAYFPYKQVPQNVMYVAARTSSDQPTAAQVIIRQVHAVDPNVSAYDISTMHERLYQSLARQRFVMMALSVFAGFALILAVIGVYGVLSYAVSQGRRDIGVRLMLGAQSSEVLRLVLQHGLALAFSGIVIGLAGSVSLSHLMQSLLFEVKATDKITLSLVALLLLVIALIASYIPAQRAVKVDLLAALRDE